MRFRLIFLVAAVAASVTATAGASPSRTPVVTRSIKWSLDTDSRNGPCNTWAHEEGIYEVDAGSVGEIPAGKRAGSFIHPIQGLQGLDKDPRWAILYAAGQARVHIKRTLKQEGQTNACGDVGVVKTKFPPNDCGERTYVSRSALIRPDYREGFSDLKDILALPKRFDVEAAISIDAPAQQLLYQRCGALESLASPVGVQNVAMPVLRSDLSKLRSVQLGERVQLEFVRDTRPWACGLPQAPGWSCSANVDLHVDIRRVKPPSGR